MSKVTAEIVPPVEPEREVVLRMPMSVASHLFRVCGNITGGGDARNKGTTLVWVALRQAGVESSGAPLDDWGILP